MALQGYTGPTNYVSQLDNRPNADGGLTAEQLKAVFDQFGTEFVEWFNGTFVPALNEHIDGVVSETIFTTHDTSVAGVQTITGLTANKVPKRIEIRTGVNDSMTFKLSVGSWEANGPAQSVVGMYKNGSSYVSTYDNTCAVIAANDSVNVIRGTVQNVTATQFEINWARTGAPTGEIALQIIAHYR